MQRVARNEIEALAKKAARGAGLSWGLAEDAGKAARLLAAHPGGGIESFVETLEARLAATAAFAAPRLCDGGLRRARGARQGLLLCPLTVGAALCDLAATLQKSATPFRIDAVARPLLLWPFVARAARKTALAIEWKGARVVVFAGAIIAGGEKNPPRAESVSIVARPPPRIDPRPAREIKIAPAILARLEKLAARTLAPASDSSRAGAGGRLPDDD